MYVYGFFLILLQNKIIYLYSKMLQNFTGDEDVNSDSSIKTPDDSLYNVRLLLPF